MIEIKDIHIESIPIVQTIVEKTWWPTYSELLSVAQIQYMLDTIYSVQALKQVMTDGSQKFIAINENKIPGGFAAYGLRAENASVVKLHKLYILPEHQGKGYGRLLIEEIITRLKKANIRILELNVKRDNPAKTFYEKLGFKIMREEDIPLGPYWLNDYVMRVEF